MSAAARPAVRGRGLLPADHRAGASSGSTRGTGTYDSQRSGRGPHAWTRPLAASCRCGAAPATSCGVIWADDPTDRLVPGPRASSRRCACSPTRRSTALDAAAQFEEMQFLADHDPLTRLLNRRVFNERLEQEVSRATCATAGHSRSSLRPERVQGAERRRGHAGRRRGARGRSPSCSPTAAARSTPCSGSAATSSPCCCPRPASRRGAGRRRPRARRSMASDRDARLASLAPASASPPAPQTATIHRPLFRAADRAMYVAKPQHRPAPA